MAIKDAGASQGWTPIPGRKVRLGLVGIVAHRSALQKGDLMKIPQYKL